MNIEDWVKWLEDNRAEEVKHESLEGVSDLTDDVIVATALNYRHLSTLAEDAMLKAKESDQSLLYADGLGGGDWIVLDFGHYMIHLFLPRARKSVDLEGLWKSIREGREERDKDILTEDDD